jgi:photoactive yellow protein
MTTVTFGDPDLVAKVDAMGQDELDELPFGVLKLDGQGRIIGYNRLEEQIAGVDYSSYLSRHFFTEIAPCMDNPFFRGRFEDGIAQGNLAMDFEFESDLDPRAEHIRVRMLNAREPNAYWIFIKRL